jgi:hypothetical protein
MKLNKMILSVCALIALSSIPAHATSALVEDSLDLSNVKCFESLARNKCDYTHPRQGDYVSILAFCKTEYTVQLNDGSTVTRTAKTAWKSDEKQDDMGKVGSFFIGHADHRGYVRAAERARDKQIEKLNALTKCGVDVGSFPATSAVAEQPGEAAVAR